jgi:DNA-directed RNA polymerase specialized sigma subunit
MREVPEKPGEPLRSKPSLTDGELLTLFQENAQSAWRLFIDRYANAIFSLIRSLGFDYDAAMDRFVFVCEKLCANDFHRLKTIRYAGSHGDLTPWIRQVVKRLCINWAWSEEGRRRLLKPIARLGPLEQRVFELYFWQGLLPSEVEERLRQEHFPGVAPAAVFEALDKILSHLSEKKLWRLISNLARARGPLSLDETGEDSGPSWDVADFEADPESHLLQREQDQILQRALQHLPERQILMLQFRFEHALSLTETARIMRIEEREVRQQLDSSLVLLRKIIKSEL